jgi:phospholipid-binding lipoprotein MlaA
LEIKIPGVVFGAFPENSVVRIFVNEKRQKTVEALSNLKIRYMLSLPSSARSGLAVVASVALFGVLAITGPVYAGSDVIESGKHPSLDHYSAEFLSVSPIQVNDIPVLEVADLGGIGEDGSDDYLIQIQLAQAADDVNDPLEGFNRAMFGFNEFVYDSVLGPVADVYNVLPHEMRTIFSSFLSNLSEPIVFINDLLQGEVERAMTTFTRFAMNSTIGFGGLADVATAAGIEGHDEDFGQTLAVWGVGEGPYLVLPLLGPSNPRDATGQYLIDTLLDPVNIYLDNQGEDDWLVPRAAAVGFDDFASVRDDLVTLKKNSIDYYAAIRSLYRQKREIEISNGLETDLPAIPDFEFSDIPNLDDPAPALSDTKDEDNGDEGDGEMSALTQAASAGDYSMSLDPFEPRFAPENQQVTVTPTAADDMLLEGAWQAQVTLAKSSR